MACTTWMSTTSRSSADSSAALSTAVVVAAAALIVVDVDVDFIIITVFVHSFDLGGRCRWSAVFRHPGRASDLHTRNAKHPDYTGASYESDRVGSDCSVCLLPSTATSTAKLSWLVNQGRERLRREGFQFEDVSWDGESTDAQERAAVRSVGVLFAGYKVRRNEGI